MEYNSQKPKMILPAYGRLVQQMVERALQEPDRQKRQAIAEHIVQVMARLRPAVARSADGRQMLWDDLAYLAKYQLDIDYPFDIQNRLQTPRPARLPYPGNNIRMRHYGYLAQMALDRLKTLTPGTPRYEQLMEKMALRMKRNLADWRGEGIDNGKVARDVALYTDGLVNADEVEKALSATPQRATQQRQPRTRFVRRNRR